MNRKVSLVMPCYNAELYIDVMLASVYSQIHNDIELICVNDGSTDLTLKKLEAWKPILEKKGYTMVIVSKENGGQCSAINAGIKLMTGDYVCFPDADDMLMPEYVSKMLKCLEENPSEQWVSCDYFVNDINDRYRVTLASELTPGFNGEDPQYLMENLLLHHVSWAVWRMMVRTKYFRKCFPNMHLEDQWPVQEFQLLLPLAAHSNWLYLDNPLYFYIRRSSGYFMSLTKQGYDKAMAYYEGQYDVARDIIKKLDVPSEKIERWELLCDVGLSNERIACASDLVKASKMERLKLTSSVINIEMDKVPIKVLSEGTTNHLLYLNAVDKLLLSEDIPSKEIYKTLESSTIYLYGAGKGGGLIVPFLLAMGFVPRCIWDKNAGKTAPHIAGVSVLPPCFDLVQNKEEAVVIISISKPNYVQEAKELLQKEGFKKIVLLDDVFAMIRSNIVEYVTRGA